MPHVVLTWPSERAFIWKSRLVLEMYSACGSFSVKKEQFRLAFSDVIGFLKVIGRPREKTFLCLKTPLCILEYLMPLKFWAVQSSKVKKNKRKILCVCYAFIYIMCVYKHLLVLYKCGAERNF